MAFNRDFMARQGGGGKAPTLWTYKTQDTLAVCDTAGYFNSQIDEFQLGDTIFVSVVTNIGLSNEALSDQGALVVNSLAAAAVDTTDETAFVTADAD